MSATRQILTFMLDATPHVQWIDREADWASWLTASGNVESTQDSMITPSVKRTKPAVTIRSLLRYLLAVGQSLC
ncbi:MAG: hypothetical protein VX739_17350, partial [Planctomycetota bacterium]|nr:hypothetical protein [Planctomycetota bacterium]